MEEKERANLRALVESRFEQSMSVPEAFFAQEAGRIAEACWAMARRFHQGGRLLAFGNGAGVTDAQHVSVEFVCSIGSRQAGVLFRCPGKRSTGNPGNA